MSEKTPRELIKDFVNSQNLKDSKSKIDRLNHIEKVLGNSLNKATEQDIWNSIWDTDNKESSKIKYQYDVLGYLKHYKLKTELYEHNMKNVGGDFVNLPKVEAKVQEEKKKVLPPLKDILDKLKRIDDPQYAFVFNYLCSKDIVRLDLAQVKRKNYNKETDSYIEDGVIYFKPLNKTSKEHLPFKLSEEQIELVNKIEYKKDDTFLLNIGGAISSRCSNYGKRISDKSKMYFGTKFCNTDFRKMVKTHFEKLNEHLPLQKKLAASRELAKRMGHSVKVADENYLQETSDINVSIEVKKILNVIDTDGSKYEFDLQELINQKKLQTFQP